MDFILDFERVLPAIFGVYLILLGHGVLGGKDRAPNKTLIVAGFVVLLANGFLLLSRLLSR